MSHRTIIIGDLHGCYNETIELLDKVQATSSDRIIFLGDLVDRGPNSAGCVDLAMRYESILGNHEEKHLQYQDLEKKNGSVIVKKDTHIETRRQLRPEHYDYLRSLPLYIKLPEYNAVCVHAGVFPNRSIEEQKSSHLLHIQMINSAFGEKSLWASKIPKHQEGWTFWANLWDGPERIIFGHSVLNKPYITNKAIGLDGGACFGLELWGLVLPDWEIVKVKSHINVSRSNKVFLIYNDVGTY